MKYFFPDREDETFVISVAQYKSEIQFSRFDFEMLERYKEIIGKDVPMSGIIIEYITVPEKWRRRRIGTRLLKKAINWSKEEFGDDIRFLLQLMTPTDRTNLPMKVLQGWYEKHGFRLIEDTTFMIF
jgi:GNAT superfamily N-acetyltransferase